MEMPIYETTRKKMEATDVGFRVQGETKVPLDPFRLEGRYGLEKII